MIFTISLRGKNPSEFPNYYVHTNLILKMYFVNCYCTIHLKVNTFNCLVLYFEYYTKSTFSNCCSLLRMFRLRRVRLVQQDKET